MPTSPLTIHLFGPMHVLIHGEPMPRLRTRSVEWLLALLVLRHERAVDRSWLAGTFWPDSDAEGALHNLRNNLVHLRKALGVESERLQSPTRDTLLLRLNDAQVDVVAFDRAMQSREPDALRRAVEAYTGPLLEGCFEEWAAVERNRCEQACLKALEMLADVVENDKDFAEALILLRRAESMDPLRDTTQRGLMRVLAASGDTPAALYTYREYRIRLRQQMNVEPDPETVQLYTRIREEARQAAEGKGPLPAASRSPSPTHASPAALPTPLTPLIGREQELHDIADAFSRFRLVTLVGGGGVGKTRLSIEVARRLAAETHREAAFVELAALSEPALLPNVVATALGIREEANPDPASVVRALTTWFAQRSVLLVLDNCEHLIDASASLAQTLLERCPQLCILATSRQRLGVTGEVAWRVPSLPVPDREQLRANPTDALTFPAIQLFVERASSASADFQLTRREDVETACHICRRLDGIPLAIELAAARVRSLSLEDINSKLDQRFRLLTGGSRAALPRQQTLRSLIDWSYDLLNEPEKTLLCRVSVFSGGWTLEAAEAVVGGPGSGVRGPESGRERGSGEEENALVETFPLSLLPQHSIPGLPNSGPRTPDPRPPTTIEDWEILDLLTGLVDKSLIVVERSGASVRYRLLETIRQYAADRLRESGEGPDTRERHQAYFLRLGEEAESQLRGPEQRAWLERLETEHDNLRSAVQGIGEPELRLAAALWRFWMIRGYVSEGRARSEELLTHYVNAPPSLVLARALHAAGNLACLQADFPAARRHYERAAAMRNMLGDRAGEAATRANLATVSQEEEDYITARDQFERSLAIHQEVGDTRATCVCVTCLGNLHRKMGELAAAQKYLREAVRLNRELGDRAGEANALNLLGIVYRRLDNAAEAQNAFQQSLAINRELGYDIEAGHNLNNLALLARDAGNLTEAAAYYAEALNLKVTGGNRREISVAFNQWAILEALRGMPHRAACLLGAGEMCLADSAPLPTAEKEDVEDLTSQLRDTLGESTFAAEFERGRAMTLEQAVALAMQGVNA